MANFVKNALSEEEKSIELPYKLRVLKSYEIIDGCCEANDLIRFRLPLRGAASQMITPTLLNAFKKFSVRFFIRAVINVAQLE